MEVIKVFLRTLFAEHCPCFVEQCKISNISTDSVTSNIVNEVAKDISSSLPTNGSCSTIFSSDRADNDSIVKAKNMVHFYLDYFVHLGLLVPPSTIASTALSKNSLSGSRFFSGGNGNFADDDGNLDLYPENYDDVDDDDDEELMFHGRRPSKENRYLMWDGDILSWNKVQSLKSVNQLPRDFVEEVQAFTRSGTEIVELVQTLFWYFRKAMVDSIITSIMASAVAADPYKAQCMAISSGSIRLSSDYDINVYGDCSEMLGIFFEEEVYKIFGEQPGYVFDSNVYSSSFMNKYAPQGKKNWYTQHKCGAESFYYLDFSDKKVVFDQHVWAALKIVKTVAELKKEPEYSTSMVQVHNVLQDTTVIWDMLTEIYSTLMEVKQSSHGLLFESKMSKGISLQDWANHLSTINFKGSETYFTRGAFLDVVANGQICKGKNTATLNKHIYFDSFIENLADFCLHHRKVKYLQRMKISRGYIEDMLRYDVDIKKTIDYFLKTEEIQNVSDITVEVLLQNGVMLCERVLSRDVESLQRVRRYVQSLVKRALPSTFALS